HFLPIRAHRRIMSMPNFCSECAAPLNPQAKFCANCGTPIAMSSRPQPSPQPGTIHPPSAYPPTAQDPPPTSNTRYCLGCRTPLPSGTDLYCSRCGPRSAASGPPPSHRAVDSDDLILGIGGLVVSIAVAVLAFIPFQGQVGPPDPGVIAIGGVLVIAYL